MKKILLSSMALVLTLALSACGGGKEAATPAPETAAPMEKAAPAKPAEGSAPVVPVEPVEPDTSVEEAMEDVGDAMEDAAEDVGDAMEDAADAVGDAVEAVKEEVTGGSNLDKLMDTTWKFEDGTTLKFKDEETVNVTGGAVSFLGDNGIDASFEYNESDNSFELSAMGQSRSGTWDGETLTIDGNAAEMQ